MQTLLKNPISPNKIHNELWSSKNVYVSFLKKCKGKSFFCCQYKGNPGDRLIQNGTSLLLADMGILTVPDINEADFLLYAGGCPSLWRVVLDNIEKDLKNYPDKKLIIGPATFEFGQDDWASLLNHYAGQIAGLFARDKRSFENLRSIQWPANIHIGLSHDPALYLLNSEWLSHQASLASEEHILIAFRRDHETGIGVCERFIAPYLGRLNKRWPHKVVRWERKSNCRKRIAMIRKKSKVFPVPVLSVELGRQSDETYYRLIGAAAQIHTDRLHVMLLGAMLGKKVFAYSTQYDKLENVYSQSLRGWADVSFEKHTK